MPKQGKVVGAPAAAFASLSARDLEVLQGLVDGLTYCEIAARMRRSSALVQHHAKRIYRAVGARGRARATAWAVQHGFCSPSGR